ncbi:MAG: hypothetical protein ACLGHX_13500 [Acidimicrobiia bacterium]
MPAPEILDVIRVVATPAAIASLVSDGTVLQVAPDEVLVLDATDVAVDDPHAITVADDGYVGVQLDRATVEDWCEREADWPLPDLVSYFTQGMVAGLAVKIWMNGDTALVMCRTSLAVDLEARL